ncbi:MAG TPA: carboxypeptidase-like regulatory domain-containing protein [Nitrosopumilaceae archaeon]|nr:carboxypeptidase-like regulatory domain-containing protein [Nitrosopumilaceae archaeon]
MSDSAMGKLLVTVKPEKTPLSAREYPVIIGTVTDEASKPIGNAKVKLTFAREVITTTTDSNGIFRYESARPSSPGQYAINVVATKEGYGTGFGSSNYFVNTPAPVTYSKGTKGAPLTVGNYTVYLGKVTEWNLEDTCFVVFGDEYKRFLNTCDLYAMAPENFKKPTKMISTLAVMKHNDEYRLFPVSAYYDAVKRSENTKTQYVISTWNNYTATNQ